MAESIPIPKRKTRPNSSMTIVPPLSIPRNPSLDNAADESTPPRRRRSACPMPGKDDLLPPVAGIRKLEPKEGPHSSRVGQRSSTPLFKVVTDWKGKRIKKKKRSEPTLSNANDDRKRALTRQPSMSDPNLRSKIPPELLVTKTKTLHDQSPPTSKSDPLSTTRFSPIQISSPYQAPAENLSKTLPTLQKMVDKLEGEERELLVSALVATYEGDPVSLFEECLRAEITKEPRMETLMRLTCPSVCVLHSISQPFRAPLSDLVAPLIELADTITQKDIDAFNPSAPASPLVSPSFSPTFPPSPPNQFQLSAPASSFTSSSETSAFSSSSPIPTSPSIPISIALYDCISTLLSPSSFESFPLVHILSYRATQVVKEAIGGEDKVRRWAITAILFLRYIVPLVIQSSSSSSPGPRFVGKFLMKMCTDSTFTPNSSSPANHLLSSLSPLFSTFCDRIVEMGEETWRKQTDDEGAAVKGDKKKE